MKAWLVSVGCIMVGLRELWDRWQDGGALRWGSLGL